MELPKLNTPVYTLSLPLSKQTIKFRPFLVKEEKILLTAIEGYDISNVKDSQFLVDAILQVLQNCILTQNVSIDDLPSLDVEYLFLNIRKKSVGEQVEIILKHDKEGCNFINKVVVNLDSVELVLPDTNKKIFLTDTVGVVMRYPGIKAAMTTLASGKPSNIDIFYDIIINSIETIFDGANFASVNEFKKEDLREWLETFAPAQIEKVYEFFKTLPYMKTDIKYTCQKCNEAVSTEVRGTASFFT